MNNERLNCWYAIRTFNCKEMQISEFLKEKGLNNFVPMAFTTKFDKDSEKPHRVLVPVIHNYLFLQKTLPEKEILELIKDCPYPMVILKSAETKASYEISDAEMAEFRLLCDPQFDNSIFMKSDEAEAKPGKDVVVIHGPFTGVRGKLYRVKNDYYLVKAFVGIGVMLRISRWYCRVED